MGGGSEVTISVVPVPDSPYVLNGIVNKKQVMFRVETSAPKDTAGLEGLESLKTRPPLNLCLVLDRSGSMESKDKLTFAKKAMVSVMNLLQKDDIVHLVTYEDDVDVVFENVSGPMREAMIPKVHAIQTGGCTFLSGGIETGAKVLEKHHKAGYSRRLFLFSDGLANKGVQGKEGINTLVKSLHEKYSIKFDSFGIGDDYDSDIMRGIADNGGSEFYYLEKSEEIETMVLRALENVLSTVGSDARLILRGKNGCVVTKISGQDDKELSKGAILGDLHSDNVRKVLCHVDVTPSSTASATSDGSVEYLTYELIYYTTDLSPHGAKEATESIKGAISFKHTDDETLLKTDLQVMVFSVIQEAGEADLKVMEAVQRGNITEAITIQEGQLSQLKSNLHLDDETEMVSLLVKLGELSLEKLKTQGASKAMEKEYHRNHYMKGKASKKYIHAHGF
eukprot:TRINITY_DN522_c0_g1_i1.p1 TRINITY_DN522_c0_g1~~TRINITY_DN522_c0_g1_i1.p1  ORF type:complete len:450 (+),score=104.18 TRINITY_DN522_c0_g1_i1:99-1448(+)